jgi:hypothetical protein
MVEFIPSLLSQSSIHSNEEHADKISIEVDDSLYTFRATDSGILEVEFRGMRFARNSVCFGGVLFPVSSLSLSLSLPYPALGLDISFQYCVIPGQTKHIVLCKDARKYMQFIAFES